MRQTSPAEVTSYAGAITSIVSSLTLTDVGIIVGVVTALLTFGLNAWFGRRKDQREKAREAREQEEHEARMRALNGACHE